MDKRPVSDYEELYYVTSEGTVHNLKGRLIKPRTTNSGYCLIHLWKHNVRKAFTVHRLVALAFIENPENKPQVNHKNGIKTDNRLKNLEWVNRSENSRHMFKIGLGDNLRQKASERLRKISTDKEVRKKISFTNRNFNKRSIPVLQFDLKGNLVARFISGREARRVTGVSNLSHALKGVYSTAGGFVWRYESEIINSTDKTFNNTAE